MAIETDVVRTRKPGPLMGDIRSVVHRWAWENPPQNFSLRGSGISTSSLRIYRKHLSLDMILTHVSMVYVQSWSELSGLLVIAHAQIKGIENSLCSIITNIGGTMGLLITRKRILAAVSRGYRVRF